MRKRFHDQIERRPKMQVHRALEILALQVLEGADFNNARIVDHDVKATEMIDDLLNGGVDLRAIKQIARDREHFAAALHKLFARVRQFIGIAREQRDTCAFRAKLAREDQSKSPRSTSDQDDFVGKRTGSASRS
jgi:hypothetical protein